MITHLLLSVYVYRDIQAQNVKMTLTNAQPNLVMEASVGICSMILAASAPMSGTELIAPSSRQGEPEMLP